jgi:hypothetical protein
VSGSIAEQAGRQAGKVRQACRHSGRADQSERQAGWANQACRHGRSFRQARKIKAIRQKVQRTQAVTKQAGQIWEDDKQCSLVLAGRQASKQGREGREGKEGKQGRGNRQADRSE